MGQVLTVSAAARLLDVSVERVEELLDAGELAAYQLGDERLVYEASLHAYARRAGLALAGHFPVSL